MIYRYGYEDSAIRFSKIIKNLVDQSMTAVYAAEIQTHEQLIQDIVQQTEKTLFIQKEDIE